MESFWDQTPFTLSLAFEAYADRQRDQHNDRMSLAWHIAMLTRAEKPPRLKRLLVEIPGREPWRKQLVGLMAWASARGDKIIRKSEGHKHG